MAAYAVMGGQLKYDHSKYLVIAIVVGGASLLATEASAFPTTPFNFTAYPAALPGLGVSAISVPDHGHVYALGASGSGNQAIYYSHNEGAFVQVSGAAVAIGGDKGDTTAAPYVFVANAAGQTYWGPNQMIPSGFWELANDTTPATSIDLAGTGGLYDQWGPYGNNVGVWILMTSTSGQLFGRYNPVGSNGGPSQTWGNALSVPGMGNAKKVASNGRYTWVIDTAGHIFRSGLNTPSTGFTQIGGCAHDVAVGATGEAIVVGCGAPDIYGNYGIYHYVDGTGFVADNAGGIAVGASKSFYGGNLWGKVYVITASSGNLSLSEAY